MAAENWTRFAKATYKIEQQYAPKFERLILDYRRSLLTDIHAHGITETRNRVASTALMFPVAPLLQTLYKKAGLMGAKMQHAELRQVLREGKKAHTPAFRTKAGFGYNDQWVQHVLSYLRLNVLNMAQNITETMRADALKILSAGIDEGWSIDQMTKALKDTRLIERRARVIARTETVRAANVGHQIGAQSLPYEMNKKWIAAKDHRTRHSHMLVNGQTVDELGTFAVPVYKGFKPTGTVDQMQAPGDPNASAANTVNCRCRVIFEPKTDEQGRYINRPSTPATVVRMPSSLTGRNNIEPAIEIQMPTVPEQQPMRAVFVPAKTIQEAEQYAERNFITQSEIERVARNRVEVEEGMRRNPNARYDYKLNTVDFKGMGIDVANKLNEHLTHLFNEHPALEKLRAIETKIVRKEQWAARMSNTGSLQINSKVAKGLKYLEANSKEATAARKQFVEIVPTLEKRQAEGKLTRQQEYMLKAAKEQVKFKRAFTYDGEKGFEGLITHEFGHHVDNQMRALLKAEGKDYDVYASILKEGMIQSNLPEYKYNISSYAFESIMVQREEVFAECFTLYQKGLYQDIPPRIKDAFDYAFKEIARGAVSNG